MNNRESAYALTRITYGVIFLFYGIGKLMGGLSNFVGGMNQQFSGKLPAAMVMPFAYFIPFAETLDRPRLFRQEWNSRTSRCRICVESHLPPASIAHANIHRYSGLCTLSSYENCAAAHSQACLRFLRALLPDF